MPINLKDLTPLPWASVGPTGHVPKNLSGRYILASGMTPVAVFETEKDCDAVALAMNALQAVPPAGQEFTHNRLLALAHVVVAGQSEEMSHFPWVALAQGFLALDAENQRLQDELRAVTNPKETAHSCAP